MMKLIRLLSSSVVMYILAGFYALVLALATFLENSYGSGVVREYFYYAPWFILLQLLQVFNLLGMFLWSDYFKKVNKGSLLFHGAFLFIWLGAACTHYLGETGIMHIREGETTELMMLDDGNGKMDLPFSVTLEKFRLQRYSGSNSPMSYESDLIIRKKSDNIPLEATIRMNKVIEVDGYRLFQSSFDKDEQGTVLSVSYDRPGMQITYTGYFMLFVGFLVVLFSKNSRFGRLRRQLAEMNAKVPFVLFVFFLACIGQSVYAQDSSISTVSASHADKFGHLLVLNPNGRLEPVNTYTSTILRKLSGKDQWGKFTSDQFFLNLLVYPQVWIKQPFIKVANKEIFHKLGKMGDYQGKAGEYLAWQDVFDAQGVYLLSEEVNRIYEKPLSARTRLDSDLLKLDESINIVYRMMERQLLPLFPDENDATGKWYSAGDDLSAFHGKDSLFVSKIMNWYISELQEAGKSGNWTEADKIRDMIGVYQHAKNKGVELSEKKINAELFYNRADLYLWCKLVYLIAGGILLLLVAAEWFTNVTHTRKYGIFLVILLGVAFAVHTGGLGLRWYIAGHAPWSNAYESMIFTSWMLVGCGLLFARRFRVLVALAALLGGIMLFVAGLNHMNPEITPLVPVLQSYWLLAHVAIIMIGYVFFAICALIGLLNLLLMTLLTPVNAKKLHFRIQELTVLNEMAMIVGLFFMTAGTFLGAIWANVSWGRYWGWDPKEAWALISVVMYALVLHLRFLPLLKGKIVWCFNFLSVISILSVLMTWFGVNYYLSGLHSYGKSDGDLSLWMWAGGFALVVALALIARKRQGINPL